jgi:hypothetical protein
MRFWNSDVTAALMDVSEKHSWISWNTEDKAANALGYCCQLDLEYGDGYGSRGWIGRRAEFVDPTYVYMRRSINIVDAAMRLLISSAYLTYISKDQRSPVSAVCRMGDPSPFCLPSRS